MEKIRRYAKYLVVIAAALIIAGVGAASASWVLQSNTAHVTLAYQVKVDTIVSGSVVTLKSSVTNQGNPVNGVTVTFYQTDSTGNILGGNTPTWTSTVITGSDGVATTTYTASGNIDTYFTAYATIQ